LLADEVARARRAEQVRLWDANEETLARRLPFRLPQVPLAEDVAGRWIRFVKWCEDKNVRSLPAKPAVVAAWILDATDLGMSVANVLAVLDAVEQAHLVSGQANVVRAALPRLALERIVKTEPPRSWSAASKAEWALLPVDIRYIISEREQQRDSWFRREQNRAAEERKKGKEEGGFVEKTMSDFRQHMIEKRLSADSADKTVSNIETKGTKSEEIQGRQH